MNRYWLIIIVCLVVSYFNTVNADPYSEIINPHGETGNMWFDSLNVRFVGNWPFGAFSFATASDSLRNIAFCGSGGGVYILDVQNPTNPQKLSEKIHTRGFVFDIFYDPSDSMLAVASGEGGLELWDVKDPGTPVKLGWIDTPGSAYGIAVSGSYAYVADDDAGLRVIDISTPSNPTEVGYCDTPSYAWGVAVSGTYAYVADLHAGLQIYENLLAGVEESKKVMCSQNIKVFPNPFTTELSVACSGIKKGQKVTLEVYDVSGRLVKSVPLTTNHLSLGTDLKPGIYFLKLNGKPVGKVVKVK